jgi:hypothetical protein
MSKQLAAPRSRHLPNSGTPPWSTRSVPESFRRSFEIMEVHLKSRRSSSVGSGKAVTCAGYSFSRADTLINLLWQNRSFFRHFLFWQRLTTERQLCQLISVNDQNVVNCRGIAVPSCGIFWLLWRQIFGKDSWHSVKRTS